MENNSIKSRKLEALQAKILADNVCGELAEAATQLVFGSGSPDADIVFVGEAPGKNEDLQGEPFVGAAGKLLNEMLEMVGLKRRDVYITNIVKYRPPGNRDPLPEEKAAFLPYLRSQLAIIQPKIVATLGRHSMNCFLPDLQISKVHGQPKRIRWILTTSKGKASTTDELGGQNGLSEEMTTGLDAALASAGGQGVDGAQGDDEKRNEPYKSTVKGVSQSATQRSATKLGRSAGLASRRSELSLVILPLYHPAAALYNGALRQTLFNDFARIPQILTSLKAKT
jgi:uracil-DNA glycosylase